VKIILDKNEAEHKTINISGSITSVLTVLFYILFSAIKRFGQNDVLYWIPFILFITNLLILLEMLYTVIFRNYAITRNSFIWLIIKIVVNIVAIVLVGSYFKSPI